MLDAAFIVIGIVAVIFLFLIFVELLHIRAALGAHAVLRQRGLPAFDEEVKPSAQRSLFGLSLKSLRCD